MYMILVFILIGWCLYDAKESGRGEERRAQQQREDDAFARRLRDDN